MNKFWLILAVLISLSACTGERCIDADDFGFANLTVSARYTKDELSQQFGAKQVAPWRDSSYTVNGRPLTILVRTWSPALNANIPSQLSAWCPWYGDSTGASTLSPFCVRLNDCQYIDDDMWRNNTAQITNAPCIFRNGIGLYGLIADTGSDPNLSISSQQNPAGLNFHLGEPSVTYMYDIDKSGEKVRAGGIVYTYPGNQYVGNRLFFKIVDKFYDDNSGQYRISIKSGVSASDPDPITFVTNLVKNFLFGNDNSYGLIRNIYTGIVNNSSYKLAVSAILTLYIIWTALSHLSGNIQLSHTELIVRIFKIVIISLLLNSEYSWKFFNDYLFFWFVDGMAEILAMITNAGATGPGGSSILGLMIAPQTMAKLFSLLFVDPMGFIYIILFLFALYFVVVIFFNAAVIYLTALIAIGMIIVMGPIFLCFMLFGITRSLFENWLKQLISYSIQPIILFTGLVFISMILRQEIYASLGFRVCKQTIFDMSSDGGDVLSNETANAMGFDIGNSFLYWWFPDPMKGGGFTKTLVDIPIPIDHYANSSNSIIANNDVSNFCPAYGCIGPRYIDLPFLDPVSDTRRLNQFWSGKFVQVDGMLLIFIAIYMLHKFNGMTVSIAKFITSTSGNFANISDASGSAVGGINSGIGQASGYVKGKLANTSVGRAVTDTAARLKNTVNTYSPSAMVDEARIALLKDDAISARPNKTVVAEVKKMYGFDHKDVKIGANQNYKKALQKELKQMDPSLSNTESAVIAKAMSGTDPKNLKNELAKAMYKKDYDQLSNASSDKIKEIANSRNHGGKSLQELANDADFAKKYSEAYIDAHQALSARGVGLFGKNISSLRSLEELEHKIDQKEQLQYEERRIIGQSLYSGFEGLKYKASGGLLGRSDNEINTSDENNHRMQTYTEQLADQNRALKYASVDQNIKDLSQAHGTNVIAPEFIARAKISDSKLYQKTLELQKQEVENMVYGKLASSSEPVLKGDKFMRENARDSEMTSGLIDRAEKMKKEIINSDELLARESFHENKVEMAEEKILDVKETLEQHLGREVTEQEMPDRFEEYLKNEAKTDLSLNSITIKEEVDELRESIKDFNNSERVIEQIDERKQMISDEVDRHIAGINNYRAQAGEVEYRASTTSVGKRLTRKIEDLRRPGK